MSPPPPPRVVPDGAPVAAARPSLPRHIFSSVRWRLILAVVTVVGLALFGGAFLLISWVKATLVADLRNRNEVVLATMADALGEGRLPSELVLSQRAIEQRLTPPGGSDDIDDVLSTTYFFLEGEGVAAMGVRGLVDDSGRMMLFGRSSMPALEEGDYVEVVRYLNTNLGQMELHAVTPLSEVQRSVQTLTGALVVGLPALTFAAGAMTWLITGRTLQPVAAMTRRVREISATTLDGRVPVPPTNDEIGELAVTMNEMLERLQRASVIQQQFISDASHELRSPVASIRAQLETALRYPDDVEWPKVAEIVLAEDERLDHLVGNLLTMARLEEGRRGPRSEVDLDDLVHAQMQRLTGVEVDMSAVSAGRVWGSSSELTSVVRNLIDNAARHARSKVWASVREEGPWVVVRISDDGDGVPVVDRERIFERFARLDDGRSRDGGGAGLGLALSRRIVEQHGGTLHVEDARAGGAMFVATLPSAAWGASGDAEGGHGQVVEEPLEGGTR